MLRQEGHVVLRAELAVFDPGGGGEVDELDEGLLPGAEVEAEIGGGIAHADEPEIGRGGVGLHIERDAELPTSELEHFLAQGAADEVAAEEQVGIAEYEFFDECFKHGRWWGACCSSRFLPGGGAGTAAYHHRWWRGPGIRHLPCRTARPCWR